MPEEIGSTASGHATFTICADSRHSRLSRYFLLHIIRKDVLPLVQPPAVLHWPGCIFSLGAEDDFRVQSRVGVGERLAADRDQVRLAIAQNLFRLVRIQDQAD